MDNIFEILIYLFIIISFLSSLFKKKKKEAPQPPANQQRDKPYPQGTIEPQQKPQGSSEVEEYNNIMREIENLFKGDSPKKVEAPPKPKNVNMQTEIEKQQQKKETNRTHYETDWHQQIESEHQTTLSEHTSENKWEKQRDRLKVRSKEIDRTLGKKALEFEKLLERREYENTFIKNLHTKMRNPQNLKEFIVMSEILGKPKSLRR